MNENREMMIERYLDGTMAPSERQEFMRRMAADAELRRNVGAEKVIRNAVRSDRAAAQAAPGPSRDRFLAMLTAVSAEMPPAHSPSGGGSSPAGGSSRHGARLTAWIAGGLGLLIIGLLVVPRLVAPSDEQGPAASRHTVAPSANTSAPALPSAPSTGVPMNTESNRPAAAPEHIAAPEGTVSSETDRAAAAPSRNNNVARIDRAAAPRDQRTPATDRIAARRADRTGHVPVKTDNETQGKINTRLPAVSK